MNSELNTVATQLQKEIMALIWRYSDESDLTVYETLGALEVCKDIMLALHRKNGEEQEEQ